MSEKMEKLEKPKNDNVTIKVIDESSYRTLEQRIMRKPEVK